MAAIWVLTGAIGVLIGAEIACRLAFRLWFRFPFHDRRIAEYPYRRLLEQTAPPVHCVFRRGFRSDHLNTNRFGLRGDEPAPNGEKRRILVIGESNWFGAKLRDERRIWAKRMQELLTEAGHGEWEVLNGGTPLYGSAQHWHFWTRALAEVRPEIVVVGIGGNDVAQMTVLGERWTPEAHWPFEFLLKLERKGTWWNAFLSRFCLYFLLRRLFEAPPAPHFPKGEGLLPWEACKRHILDQYRNFHGYASRTGIRIAFTNSFPLYTPEPTPGEERRLWAIQANYRDSIERDGRYFFELQDAVARGLCPELGVPYLDLKADFDAYPRRYECWYDLGHWNERGMDFIAKALYRRIDPLGWWE